MVCLRPSRFLGIEVEASIYSTATTAFIAWYVSQLTIHISQGVDTYFFGREKSAGG